MMLFGSGLKVPQLRDGASAIWNRRVWIETASTPPDLQDQVNAFLEDLGVNPDYALGAAVLGVQMALDPPNDWVALVDYGFYSPT